MFVLDHQTHPDDAQQDPDTVQQEHKRETTRTLNTSKHYTKCFPLLMQFPP